MSVFPFPTQPEPEPVIVQLPDALRTVLLNKEDECIGEYTGDLPAELKKAAAQFAFASGQESMSVYELNAAAIGTEPVTGGVEFINVPTSPSFEVIGFVHNLDYVGTKRFSPELAYITFERYLQSPEQLSAFCVRLRNGRKSEVALVVIPVR